MAERDIAAARRDAEAAKARFFGTVHELQERLAPRNLVDGMRDSVVERGQEAARSVAGAVRARPVAAVAMLTGVVAFLARKPLWALVGRFRQNRDLNGEDQ